MSLTFSHDRRFEALRAPVLGAAAVVLSLGIAAGVVAVARRPPVVAAAPRNLGVSEEQAFANAKRLLAEALTRRMTLERALPGVQAAAPVVEPTPSPIAVEVVAAVEPVAAQVTTEELHKLAGKAAWLLRNGDIASARLILERAIKGADATAIYALAETYDPNFLNRLNVQGFLGDAARARALYAQALEAGVTEAAKRMAALAQ